MTVFKNILIFGCLLTIFSCEYEKREVAEPAKYPPANGGLQITNVKKMVLRNYLGPKDTSVYPYFVVTLKNTEKYDINFHYDKKFPKQLVSYVPEVVFIRKDSTHGVYNEYFCDHDTSVTVQGGKDLVFNVPTSYCKEADFNTFEFVNVTFWVLISSSQDISPLFKNQSIRSHFRHTGLNGITAYNYALQFTYWTPNRIFWTN